jgi:hypothetical protein
MLAYAHEVKLVNTYSYVNDMIYWNNFDINIFWPKDNNDTMQFLIFNKSSLFV